MRLRLIAVVLAALLLAVPGVTLAKGGAGGGGGGGTSTAIPDLAGTWHGFYSYLLFATGAVASPNNHEVLMFLNQDTQGNLTGTFCLGLVSPGCFLVKGKVGADSTVQIQFDAISNPFILKGNVAPMFCLDGSAGKVISGAFSVREGSGSFSFNNCP